MNRKIFITSVCLIFFYPVFAQPKWKATDGEWSGKRNWTFFQSIGDYPYLEFRMDTLDTTDYFNCSNYHYFSDTAFPKISYEDSVKAAEYMYWLWNFENEYREVKLPGPPDQSSIFFHLPHIQNKIDTFWLHKIIKERKTFKFGSLSFKDVYQFINDDALIKGEIIAKRYVRDTTRCVFYKTEYIIRVTEVIHSYFDIKRGDKVLAAGYCNGYEGGCHKNISVEARQVFSSCSHTENHSVGDNLIFMINRNMYQSITRHNWYQDEEIYCPQKFNCYSSRELTSEVNNKIADLKLFFKNIKNHYEQQH